jgi:hypothetical protein
MASDVLRLVHGINLEPVHEEFTLDCRLLFMGDRYRQLVRAYPEVIHRLSRPKPTAEIAAFLRESAEIAQYYAISSDAGRWPSRCATTSSKSRSRSRRSTAG